MTERQKHAELIIAWANGATIQFNDGGRWITVKNPGWYEHEEYRALDVEEVKSELSNAELSDLYRSGYFHLDGCRKIADAAIRHYITPKGNHK